MTAGQRMAAGLGLTILTAVASGGLGVWKMPTAKPNSTKPAKEKGVRAES